MTLTKLLAATCGILVLAGCGTSKSSTPAERTPPADGIAVSATKPATEATRPATDDVLKSPPPIRPTSSRPSPALSPRPQNRASRPPAGRQFRAQLRPNA